MGCGNSNGQKDDKQEECQDDFTVVVTDNLDDAKSDVYLAQAACPYAKLYTKEPGQMRDWEKRFVDNQRKGWEERKCPVGEAVNDQNWFRFGTGNTCGLFVGCLSVGESDECDLDKNLPADARHGLFKTAGNYPIVLRFSDAAPDDNSFNRLMRVALKIHFPDAWCKEINWTMTETFDWFPITDFDGVRNSSSAPGSSFADDIKASMEKMKVITQNAGAALREWSSAEVFSKDYYSCFPYAVGPKKGMKYRMVAMQDPLGEVEDTPSATVQAARNYIRARNVRYRLEIRLMEYEKAESTPGDWPSDLPWIPVGIVNLPSQETDIRGVSQDLAEALVKENVLSEKEREWLGKLFQFHPLRTDEVNHKPLGEVQQFRCHFYAVCMSNRLKTLGGGKVAPMDLDFDTLMLKYPNVAEMFQSVDNSPEPSEEMPEQLKNVDKYTRTICKAIPEAVNKAVQNPMEDTMLTDEDPKFFGPQPCNEFEVGSIKIKLMKEDHVFGKLELRALLLLRVLRTNCFFPVKDCIFDATDEEGKAVTDHLGLTQAMPKTTNPWEEMESDEAMSRLCFSAIAGALVTERSDGDTAFVVDTEYLADLPVREGFRRYGTCLHFNKDCKLLRIYDCANKTMIEPADDQWAAIKMASKASIGLEATVCHHALWTHFLVGNNLMNALVEHIPGSHPVRRLMQPFLFRTLFINNRGKDSLLAENSMFQHSTALEWKEFSRLAESSLSRCWAWQPFPEYVETLAPELQELVKEDKLPYAVDGVALFKTFHNLTTEWLNAFCPVELEAELTQSEHMTKFWNELVASTQGLKYSLPAELTRDNLANALAQVMWIVTGYHDVVGSVMEYVSQMDRVGLRARQGSSRVDFQSWLIAANLMATTSIRTPPLMSKWPNFFKETERPVWDKFQASLETLAEEIDVRNKTRDYPMNNFHPRFLECAVSV